MATLKNTRGQTALDKALEHGHQDVAGVIFIHMSKRSDAQQGGDRRPAQNAMRNLQAKKRKLSTQLAAAKSKTDEYEEQLASERSKNKGYKEQLAQSRSRIDEREEQLAAARSRIDDYVTQLAESSAENDEYEVHRACMTGQEQVIASQDLETLEPLLVNVDLEYLRKAVFEKRVQREMNNVRDAAAECGICLSAPKDTSLDPCGHTMCRACSDLIQFCPICRQTIAERRRVFW
eukprot:gene709-biopygen456